MLVPITSAEAQLFYEGSSFMNLEFFFFFKRSLFLEQRVTSINKPKSRRYNPFNKRQPASLCRGGWAHSGLFIWVSGRKGLLTQLLFLGQLYGHMILTPASHLEGALGSLVSQLSKYRESRGALGRDEWG